MSNFFSAPEAFHATVFLPARTSALEATLIELGTHTGTVVFFEAPHRIVATLQVLERLLSARRLMIGRELTKLHESLLLGTPSILLPLIQEEHRGEFICLEGSDSTGDEVSAVDTSVLEHELAALLPPRQVARVIAKVYGQDSRSVYRRLVAGQQSEDGAPGSEPESE